MEGGTVLGGGHFTGEHLKRGNSVWGRAPRGILLGDTWNHFTHSVAGCPHTAWINSSLSVGDSRKPGFLNSLVIV